MDGEQSFHLIEDEPAPGRTRRHALALVASIAAHLAATALIVLAAPGTQRPHSEWVLAYLVELDHQPGGASGGGATHASAPPPQRTASARPAAAREADARPMARVSKRRPQDPAGIHPHREAAKDRARDDAPATIRRATLHDSGASTHPASAPGDTPRDGAGGGAGSGVNGSGAGSASARVEYGENPAPIYPVRARRRAEQGTVALRILVAADGTVRRVEIISSSGFDSLDEAAIETVRTRWHFVPAMRDGVAVESWAEVPIRFALTEASTN